MLNLQNNQFLSDALLKDLYDHTVKQFKLFSIEAKIRFFQKWLTREKGEDYVRIPRTEKSVFKKLLKQWHILDAQVIRDIMDPLRHHLQNNIVRDLRRNAPHENIMKEFQLSDSQYKKLKNLYGARNNKDNKRLVQEAATAFSMVIPESCSTPRITWLMNHVIEQSVPASSCSFQLPPPARRTLFP